VTTLALLDSPAFKRLRLFLALSRTPHGLLDMATPAVAALLWLGRAPSPGVALLGLITAFAGYTAVYALNDVVDYRTDRKKIEEGRLTVAVNDLDAVYVRHPMAQGLLSFTQGLLWAGGWALVALLGAYRLNPACAAVFLTGCLLETFYCLLLQVSHWRTLVSGMVKTLGGVAAVFAVDPRPAPLFLATLAAWLFCWEIGGQNVPNDWTDLEEDRSMDARTIPVHFGAQRASEIIGSALVATVFLNLLLFALSPARIPWFIWLAALAVNGVLLLAPAYQLHQSKTRSRAAVLFNRASYYPLAMFVLVAVSLIF
jgi:4-hydroxybenzoate polyprenyltransferase